MAAYACPEPVLIMAFKRPETTRQVLDAVRQARPPRLYFAVDAARPGKGEDAKVQEVRSLIDTIDWPCQIHTQFQETNLGCRRGVEAALNWFFTHEERGIILEDDTLPSQDFFPYCAELLEKYQDDPRVGLISGCNYQYPTGSSPYSYFFSYYSSIWGWATWRRGWELYGTFGRFKDEILADHGTFDAIFTDMYEDRYQREYLKTIDGGRIDTWDMDFYLDCRIANALTIMPMRNLVVNLGINNEATNTTDDAMHLDGLQHEAMELPLRHPTYFIQNRHYDDARFFKGQKLDEMMSYYQFFELLRHKTLKRLGLAKDKKTSEEEVLHTNKLPIMAMVLPTLVYALMETLFTRF